MEQFVKDQITYGLKYLPANLIKSFFIKQSSKETEDFRNNQFIRGVCHPRENYSQIKEANIDWIRIDIPFPFNADGTECQSYLNFKNRCKGYVDNNIKVMAVTPYPRDYFDADIDVRTPEGEEKVRKIAEFFVKDLKGLVGAFQITNEMGIPHFILPLNMDEAVRFIGIQLEVMAPIKGDILVGYNSAGPQADLHTKIKPYLKYADYVGVDIYLGCFFAMPGFMWIFDAMLRYLWALTGKPILLQEFGYISGGAPKNKEEKKHILNKYGASDEKDAKENIVKFVDNLNEHFAKHVKRVCGNDSSRYYDLLFHSDLTNHLYCELPAVTKIPGYDHTPEGQGKFYRDIIPGLYSRKYLCGMFIYCYQDPRSCHVCGQEECPTETKWGLVDNKGNPKPSYYAVKKMFGRIKWLENTEKRK